MHGSDPKLYSQLSELNCGTVHHPVPDWPPADIHANSNVKALIKKLIIASQRTAHQTKVFTMSTLYTYCGREQNKPLVQGQGDDSAGKDTCSQF